MNISERIFGQISDATGWSVKPIELELKTPLYIKSSYELIGADIEGCKVIFAKAKDGGLDIRMHKNAIKKVEEIFGYKGILVFDGLKTNSKNALISSKTAFIVLDGQIYMPFALIHIEKTRQQRPQIQHQKLTPLCDMALIGYLCAQIKSGMMIKEISQELRADMRATSKALDILESLGYLQIERHGIGKKIYFQSADDIYERLSKNPLSPIIYVKYAKKLPDVEFAYSGNSALSSFSNILNEKIKTVAINRKDLKNFDWHSIECEMDEASYKIEVWDRDPMVFSVRGCVNPIYIIRAMKYEKEERVIDVVKEIEKVFVSNFKDVS